MQEQNTITFITIFFYATLPLSMLHLYPYLLCAIAHHPAYWIHITVATKRRHPSCINEAIAWQHGIRRLISSSPLETTAIAGVLHCNSIMPP